MLAIDLDTQELAATLRQQGANLWIKELSTLTIGADATSVGNQLTLAGGSISATTFVLGAGNTVAPIVSTSGVTAMAVSGTATLAAGSTVKPMAAANAVCGKFAVLTAGTLVDNGIMLDSSADANRWSVSVVGNTLYLQYRETRTLIQIR